MTSLDDLFEQIIHTERRAQARRNLLNEIKANVQQLTEKVKNTEDDCVSLHGQLASKIQTLNENDLSLKLLENKEKTSAEQLEILRTERKELKNEQEKILAQQSQEIEMFCTEVKEFTSCYGLISNGQVMREEQAKQDINELRLKQNQLKIASDEYKTKKNLILELQVQFSQLEEMKSKLEEQLNDVECQYQMEIKSTEEKEKILNSPNLDPEFVKLQQQLDSLKSENLEEKCTALQKELWQLQQHCWQKQVKDRQRQLDEKDHQRVQDPKPKTATHLTSLSVVPTSNRVQFSNFPSNNRNDQTDDLSNEELKDIFNDEFTQTGHQKSFFKSLHT